MRGGNTCCDPGCYSNTKRDKEVSFHKVHRDVPLRRNGSVLLRERTLFLVRSTVYAHSIFMVLKSKADQTEVRECMHEARDSGHETRDKLEKADKKSEKANIKLEINTFISSSKFFQH